MFDFGAKNIMIVLTNLEVSFFLRSNEFLVLNLNLICFIEHKLAVFELP